MACRNNPTCRNNPNSSIPNVADIVFNNGIDCFVTERIERTNRNNLNSCSPVTQFATRELRLCVNPNGTAGYYRSCCRDSFWPQFASPRCLTCRCLYSGRNNL